MANLKGGLGEFLRRSRVLIENARGVPALAGVLVDYGYTEAKLAKGAQLLTEAEALSTKRAKDSGESRQATEELNAAWEAANNAYVKALKVARVVFGQEAKASAALKLYGPRKQSMAGWLDQARTFYGNVQGDASLSDRLKTFGYTEAKLGAEAALVDGVRANLQNHAHESGAAQESTVGRDKKIAELDQWVSDLRAICKVAFAENPQQLEELGIVVLNAPRKKKATAASAAKP